MSLTQQDSKYTPKLYCSLTLALTAVFTTGFHLNWLNQLHTFVKCFFLVNLDKNKHLEYDDYCDNDYLADLIDEDDDLFTDVISQWSLASSLNFGMCAVGGLLFGYVIDQFGRKRTFQIGILIDLVGISLTIATYWTESFLMFTVGRALSGLAIGAYTLAAPLYFQEIAVTKDKQLFSTFFGWGFNFGTLFAQILGIEKILGRTKRWIAMPFVALGLIILMGVLSIFSEETPDWAISKGDNRRASRIVQRLHSITEFDDGDTLKTAAASEKKSYLQSLKDVLANKEVMKITAMLCFAIVGFHNFNGMPVILIFSTTIFSNSGFSNETAGYLTIATGVIAIIGSMTLSVIVDKFSKVKICVLAMLLVTVYDILMTIFGQFDDIQALNYASVVIVYLIIFTIQSTTFSISLMFPVLMIRPEFRSAATSMIVCLAWFSGFIATFIFPYVEDAMGSYCFLIYGVCAFIWAVWGWFRLVDPDGKDFDEIEGIVRERRSYI